MKIGELAKLGGVSRDAIRYYLDKGLLSARRDPNNGYQLFDQAALSRLRFIKSAQALGFHIDDIRLIFHDADDAQSPCPRVRDIIQERLQETRQRIAELTQLCAAMENAVAQWDAMPDQTPTGNSICKLIETQPLTKSVAQSDCAKRV